MEDFHQRGSRLNSKLETYQNIVSTYMTDKNKQRYQQTQSVY